MKKRKYSRILIMLFCAVFVFLTPPITANADMGPKPSVWIRFKNMGEELCYGTLLSKDKSMGPWSASNISIGDSPDAERAFVNYEDPDGYYYLHRTWTVSETKVIDWVYYPPDNFKILLYYPETEAFVSSGIYKKYAFDSYYTVDMKRVNIGSVEQNKDMISAELIRARRSYNYLQEALSLIARTGLTIVVEILVAFLFGFRKKKQLQILVVVNIVTQIILNALLNLIDFKLGPGLALFGYFLLELLVFSIEAGIYCDALKAVSEKKKDGYYVLYAFVANALSYVTGVYLACILPGIF